MQLSSGDVLFNEGELGGFGLRRAPGSPACRGRTRPTSDAAARSGAARSWARWPSSTVAAQCHRVRGSRYASGSVASGRHRRTARPVSPRDAPRGSHSAQGPTPSRSARRRGATVDHRDAARHGPGQAFAGDLAATLGRLGTTEHLTSERVDSCSTAPDRTERGHRPRQPASAALAARPRGAIALRRLRGRRPAVGLESSRAAASPTRCCSWPDPGTGLGSRPSSSRQGASSSAAGGPGRDWSCCTTPSGLAPSNRRLAAGPHGDDVYHVRIGHAADIDRLARSCRQGSASCSAAAARGFAHLGVLRLHELEVPVDLVGGTSIRGDRRAARNGDARGRHAASSRSSSIGSSTTPCPSRP